VQLENGQVVRGSLDHGLEAWFVSPEFRATLDPEDGLELG
jgi:hypothetical protein